MCTYILGDLQFPTVAPLGYSGHSMLFCAPMTLHVWFPLVKCPSLPCSCHWTPVTLRTVLPLYPREQWSWVVVGESGGGKHKQRGAWKEWAWRGLWPSQDWWSHLLVHLRWQPPWPFIEAPMAFQQCKLHIILSSEACSFFTSVPGHSLHDPVHLPLQGSLDFFPSKSTFSRKRKGKKESLGFFIYKGKQNNLAE